MFMVILFQYNLCLIFVKAKVFYLNIPNTGKPSHQFLEKTCASLLSKERRKTINLQSVMLHTKCNVNF